MPKNEPILDAVLEQNPGKLAALLLQNPEGINVTDYLNQTALILAVTLQNKVLVEMLLAYNADLYIQSYPFGTALTAAIFLKNSQLAYLLMDAEKEIYGKFDPTRHPSAFCWAIRSRKVDLVESFIKEGMRLDSFNQENFQAHPDWVWGELVDTECPFQSNPLDQRFDLPLNIAVRTNDSAIVSLLVNAGADPSLKGYAGQDAFTLARYSNDPEQMRQALQKQTPMPQPEQAIAHDPIPVELQESFKGLIQDHFEAVYEAKKQKELLVLLQYDVKTPSDYLGYAIRRVAFLDPAYKISIVFLLCCLRPQYWEERLLENFKKELLQVGYVERSSSEATAVAEKERKEQFLKTVAKDYCESLLKENNIICGQAVLQKKTVHNFSAEILWRNDPSELACFTPVRGLRRDPEYIHSILTAILYKENTGCSWLDLPRRFPTYSAISYFRRELIKRGIYESLLTQFRELQREKQEIIAQESQEATPKKVGYNPAFLASRDLSATTDQQHCLTDKAKNVTLKS